MTDKKEKLGIYVHIPFCVRKCAYCDFLSFASEKKVRDQYVTGLLNEIKKRADEIKEYRISTIYFGGGTPTVLDASHLAGILNAIFEAGDFSEKQKEEEEITVEANPGTVDFEKLSALRDAGFNRISIGVQSADSDELKMLGRIHTFSDAENAVKWARAAGFKNLSVDIISALPNQTLSKYRENLEKIVALSPDHISSYSLIIEEGTKFFELYGESGNRKKELPDEELDREMYRLTNEFLLEHGYHRYEISNYAKPGFESRHNSSYWTGVDYLGLGLGASSLIKNVRYQNETDLKKNLEDPCKRYVTEKLDENGLITEFMILGLRMTQGVSEEAFRERFKRSVDDVYGDVLKRLADEKLIVRENGILRLTEFGLDVSNMVFEEFLM